MDPTEGVTGADAKLPPARSSAAAAASAVASKLASKQAAAATASSIPSTGRERGVGSSAGAVSSKERRTAASASSASSLVSPREKASQAKAAAGSSAAAGGQRASAGGSGSEGPQEHRFIVHDFRPEHSPRIGGRYCCRCGVGEGGAGKDKGKAASSIYMTGTSAPEHALERARAKLSAAGEASRRLPSLPSPARAARRRSLTEEVLSAAEEDAAAASTCPSMYSSGGGGRSPDAARETNAHGMRKRVDCVSRIRRYGCKIFIPSQAEVKKSSLFHLILKNFILFLFFTHEGARRLIISRFVSFDDTALQPIA